MQVDRESLKLLGLGEKATLAEIQSAYIQKTWQPRFRAVILEDEALQKEFIKYYEAYVAILRGFKAEDKAADASFYPPDMVYQFFFNQGIYFLVHQNYIKASEKLEAAYGINKGDHLLLLYLGILLLKRKNYYAAEKYFTQAMKIDNENGAVWFYLGESYLQAGNLKKAHYMFERSKALDPSRKENAFRLKEVKERLGLTPKGKKKSFIARLLNK
jgi:tetratricopeptide (TPR) repeat protein